jgi:hypothetical protein
MYLLLILSWWYFDALFLRFLELEIRSLSKGQWTITRNICRLSCMFYLRGIYFEKLASIAAEIPKFVFFTKGT